MYFADPPGMPQNFKVTDTSPKSISLAWTTPAFDGGSPLLGYLVTMATGSDTTYKELASLTSTSLNYKADRLTQGESYSFKLLAENLAGISDPAMLPGPVVAKFPFGTSYFVCTGVTNYGYYIFITRLLLFPCCHVVYFSPECKSWTHL